jgi:hypothetical protein
VTFLWISKEKPLAQKGRKKGHALAEKNQKEELPCASTS